MTTPTVAVTIVSGAITGTPLANGSAVLQLTQQDIVVGTNGTFVSDAPVTVRLDANGQATGQFFPNVLGTRGTQTKVTLFDASGVQQGQQALATIPNSACNLHDVIDLSPPPSLSSAQVGVNLARQYAQQALGAQAAVSFLYQGVFATPPTKRLDGSAIQPSDRAIFTDGYEYHFTGSAWVSDAKTASDAAAQTVVSSAGIQQTAQMATASAQTARNFANLTLLGL